MGDLISVIIPVYQAERFLGQCVDSVLGQTYRNLEVILVDDGSTDGSGALCDAYASLDCRVKAVHKSNGGVSSARNAGIASMTGDYFITVDSDDYIGEFMVERLAGELKKQNADMAVCGFTMVSEDGNYLEEHCPDRAFAGTREEFINTCLVELYDKLLMNNQNNKLYSAKIVREQDLRYEESMSINEDAWFSMTMLKYSRRVAAVPEAFLFYRQYGEPQSLVTRFNANGVDTCFVLLSAVESCLEGGGIDPLVKNRMRNRMIFHICGFAGLCYYRSGYSGEKCLEEIRALAVRPEFRELLRLTGPEGLKNRLASFILKRGWCGLYHVMCLALYAGRRRRRREETRRGAI